LRDGRQSLTEPLECGFLGVDLRRRQPRCWSLWSSRVGVWIRPMSRACSRRRPVGSNGLAVRPVV